MSVLLSALLLCLVFFHPRAGAHSGGGAGRPREAGAPGDASPAQEARGPVPHDEDGLTSRE